MGPNDIGVKMGAEGVEDVIAAFQKIHSEAVAAGKGAADGIGLANEALAAMKALLPAIGLTAAVAGFVNLAKGAIETGASLEIMSQKTGMSVGMLSVLGEAARRAGVEPEKLTVGLGKFEKALDGARNGSAKAADGFTRLGIPISELKSKSPEEIFQIVADKLTNIKDPAAKAALAIGIFGKSGLNLIPIMEELAHGGFGELQQKMQDAGVYIDKDFAQKALQMTHTLEDMKMHVKGMGTQFAMGLVPEVESAMEGINRAISGPGLNGFKMLGDGAGLVIKGVAGAVIALGKTVGMVFAVVANTGTTLWQGLKDAANSNSPFGIDAVRILARSVKDAWTQGHAIGDDAFNDITNSLDKIYHPAAPPKTHTPTKDAGDSQVEKKGPLDAANEKAAKAQAEFLKAKLDNELAILKAQNALWDEEEKRKYDEGLISLQEYYDGRRAEIEKNAAQEKALIIAKMDERTKQYGKDVANANTKYNTDPKARDKELSALADTYKKDMEAMAREVELKDTEATKLFNENEYSRLQAVRQLTAEQVKGQEEMLAAEGRHKEAADVALIAERDALDIQVQKNQKTREEADEILRQKDLQNQINDGQRDLTKIYDDLGRAKQEILNQVTTGEITQYDAEQKIIQLEKDRIPLLDSTVTKMEEIAAASGNPDMVENVKKLREQLSGLQADAAKADAVFAQLKDNIANSISNDISNSLSEMADGTKSASQAFSDMAKSILNNIAKIIIQLIIMKSINSLMGTNVGGVGGWKVSSEPPPEEPADYNGYDLVANSINRVRSLSSISSLSGMGLSAAGLRPLPALSMPRYAALGAAGSDNKAMPWPITVEIKNETGTPMQGKQDGVKFDGDRYVVGVVVNNIAQGGAIRNAITGLAQQRS